MTDQYSTPRMAIVSKVLYSAKGNGDQEVLKAARRLLIANSRGWKFHVSKADIELVFGYND